MDELYSTGEWIRRRRKALDLTQKQLADLVGCAVITIAKIEADERRPSREIAALLAEHLRVPPEQRDAFIRAARAELNASRLGQAAEPELSGQWGQRTAIELTPPVVMQAAQVARPAERPLIARDVELAAARAAWERALAGESIALFISGEPGVGKSRLAAELAAEAAERGALVLTGECFAELAAPYAPVSRLLTGSLQGHWPTLPPLVQADLITIAPVLAALWPQVSPNPKLEPRAEQMRLFESAYALFAAVAARRPVLLLVEDIHWADSGSLDLLRTLARRFRQSRLRILLVFTVREAELEEEAALGGLLNDLHRAHVAVHLALDSLDFSGTRAFLRQMFDADVSAEFANLVHRVTQGNPFFIEEVCRDLVESGQVYRADGKWQRKDIEEIQAPQSVRMAIQARVSKLPQGTQELLSLAAQFGRRLELDVLAAAAGLSAEDLLETLEPAERGRLVYESGPLPGGDFEFSHALVPLALREAMPAARRRKLHRQAVRALEKLRPGEFARLAYHYAECADRQSAVKYYRQAAERARQVYANDEAIEFYTRALSLCPPDSPEACELLLGRSRVLDVLGQRDRQTADLEAATALALQLRDPGLQARAALAAGDYAMGRSEHALAAQSAQATIGLAAQAGLGEIEAEAYRLWGRALTILSDFPEARVHLKRARELYQALGLAGLEATCMLNQGNLEYFVGDSAAAREHYSEAYRRGRELGERFVEAMALTNLGNVWWLDEDLDKAAESYRESFTKFRAIGDRVGEARALSNLASIQTERRDFTPALPNLQLALERFRQFGQRFDESVVLGHLSDAYEGLGQLEAAKNYREQAREVAEAIGDRRGEAEQMVALSRLAWLAGRWEDGLKWGERALALAQETGSRPEEADASRAIGDIRAAAGAHETAAGAYEAAISIFDELDLGGQARQSRALLGRLLVRRGDREAGARLLSEILPDLSGQAVGEIDDPLVCLAGYDILCGSSPDFALLFLCRGRAILDANAGLIADAGARHHYLHGIPPHAELLRLSDGARC